MSKYTLGVDVAQQMCEWAVIDTTRSVVASGQVPPRPKALARWLQDLASFPIIRAAVEASGGWEKPVAQAIWEHGIPLVVANPKRVHRLREALGWAKTDGLDAHLLAIYALLHQETTPQPSVHRQTVQAWLKRREHLVEMRRRERQRLRRTTDEAIRKSLERSLAFLKEELAQVEQALEKAAAAWEQAEPSIARTRQLLETMPGIGPRISLVLLAWLPELGHVSRGEVAALTGTAPMANDSGQKRGRRRVREGRKRVRRYLYLGAMAAVRRPGPLQATYQRLLEAHKPKPVALVAVMRRQIVILNAMVRTGKPWEPKLAMPRNR
jgi:transposase